MAEDPEKVLAKSDHQLMVWTLSGQEDSYVHRIGETAMAMRASARMAEATAGMAKATKGLATHTKRLVYATSALVIITFLTQLALILLAFRN